MEDTIYWPSFFFLLFAAIAGAFALAVVISTNIVRMAFYLVMSLSATAGLFFVAGADFIGAMQIVIYVGGTLVLLVFGVMLTSQDRFISMKTSRQEMMIGAIIGTSLFVLLVWAAVSVPEWRGLDRATAEAVPLQPTAAPIGMGLIGARVDSPDASGYLLVFQLVAIHLLVILIGASFLARARRKRITIQG